MESVAMRMINYECKITEPSAVAPDAGGISHQDRSASTLRFVLASGATDLGSVMLCSQ